MEKIIISKNIYKELRTILQEITKEIAAEEGHFRVEVMDSIKALGSDALADHPDLCYCWLKPGNIFAGDRERIGSVYPKDCIYNACSTGKFFIHNLDITAPELLKCAEKLGLIFVNVKQGYAKCSIVVVDEDSIITYDHGIAKACRNSGMSVLEVEPGFVELDGYSTGFIGGTSGLLSQPLIEAFENENFTKFQKGDFVRNPQILFFNGNLDLHPSAEKIRKFANERGVGIIDCEGSLRDIGSIIIG